MRWIRLIIGPIGGIMAIVGWFSFNSIQLVIIGFAVAIIGMLTLIAPTDRRNRK